MPHGCLARHSALGSCQVKLALSILCEHPSRRTGLTTLFHEFIAHALPLYPEIDWIIFAGPNQEWLVDDPRVDVVRRYPANDHLSRRLLADHFLVPTTARRLGAAALLTVGFVPLWKSLPVAMHLFSLQHLSGRNRLGFARGLYRRLIIHRSVDQAEIIIVNSHFTESQFFWQFPGARNRTIVSYEGLRHDQFCPDAPADEAASLRAEFGLEPGYLLWVSNFYDYKQADRLLAAYARLSPEHRAAHPLVMAGGEWRGGLDAARAYAQELGITGDVRFLGWIDDRWLAPLYRHARLYCLASREETFGRCVAEAMACGVPCVVNRIPVMDEVTGGHALIVDYRDAAAVVAALETLLADDVLHARLRAEGMAWVRQFSFGRLTTERLDAMLATLRGEPRPVGSSTADRH